MPVIETHVTGMPVWLDATVVTSEQRERLMAFYASLFSWTWDVGTEETGHYSIAHHDDQPVFGLGQGPGGEGNMVTYFSTDDIHASSSRATELGANVFMTPMEVMEIGTMALVLDPVGAVHGLWQPKSFLGFGVEYEPNAPGWFDHASEDPARAANYYQSLTGHDLVEPEPSMRILQAGEQWFASISQNQLAGRRPQWNAVVICDSLERIRREVRSLGGTVVVDEMPVPGSAITVFLEPVMNAFVTVAAEGSAEA